MNAHVEAFLSTFISVGDNDVLLVQLSIKYHQFSLIKKVVQLLISDILKTVMCNLLWTTKLPCTALMLECCSIKTVTNRATQQGISVCCCT